MLSIVFWLVVDGMIMHRKLSFNKVVKYLVLSDLAFWAGWGFFNPLLAIFIVDKIQGGNAMVVGIAAAVFWIADSLFRVPVGIILDSNPKERDDYFALVAGLFTCSLVPFGYLFASLPWHVYLLQGLHGFGLAMSLAGWTAIFTRHIDKGKESTGWGLDATVIGLGAGITGAAGGWLVTRFGFDLVLVMVGIFSLVGTILLLGAKKYVQNY